MQTWCRFFLLGLQHVVGANPFKQSMYLSHSPLPYDPNRLFDALEKWLGVSTNRSLSRALKLQVSVIRNMRAGRQPIRVSVLLLIAEAVGKDIDELRELLGDKRQKLRM